MGKVYWNAFLFHAALPTLNASVTGPSYLLMGSTQEKTVARIYGEAVETHGQAKPWAAVLYSDGGEINRAPADTRDEAEALVRYFLEKLAAYARRGFEPDEG